MVEILLQSVAGVRWRCEGNRTVGVVGNELNFHYQSNVKVPRGAATDENAKYRQLDGVGVGFVL